MPKPPPFSTGWPTTTSRSSATATRPRRARGSASSVGRRSALRNLRWASPSASPTSGRPSIARSTWSRCASVPTSSSGCGRRPRTTRHPSRSRCCGARSSAVLDRAEFPRSSHSGKDLTSILETYPRDELFQIGEDELYAIGDGHPQPAGAQAGAALRAPRRPRALLLVPGLPAPGPLHDRARLGASRRS